MEAWYRISIGLARALWATQRLRVQVSGFQQLPGTGGAVLASNHISHLDFTFVGLAGRKRGRWVRFMAKEAVFRTPVAGTMMRGMKHISVDRARGAQSYAQALDALSSGELVGIFPEATISRSFELKTFKSGAVRMATDAQVPIFPVIVWGGHRVWTKDHPRRLLNTKVDVHVLVGAPLHFAADEDPETGTARLREQMATMLAQVQADYPKMPAAESAFVPARLGGDAPTPARAAELDATERAERAAKSTLRRKTD